LIVDRGPAHVAKKTRAFVESLNGGLRLFNLPPYPPDRNLILKPLKADTVGRIAVTDTTDFKKKVRASMRQLQKDPKKSDPSTKSHPSNTLRESAHTYGLIK
jgi:hypothetical protein